MLTLYSLHRHLISCLSMVILALMLVGCGASFDPTKPRASGDRHVKLTVNRESHWIAGIAIDSLARRILGLNWNVRQFKDRPNEFEIWPVPTLNVSDARLYQVAKMFATDPWVIEAQPHYDNTEFVPVDGNDGTLPHDDPQWYMGPLGINAYEAWEMFRVIGKRPGEGVLVAQPDTGYFDHPELFRADGSTQLRLDLQRNFFDIDKPNDAHDYCNTWCGLTLNKTYKLAYAGHGTTTASMIISPTEKHPDTVGTYNAEGAAPYAELIPLRISNTVLLNPSTVSNMAKAIRYGVSQGAKVVSISMGGFFDDTQEITSAVRDAHQQGVIIVAAAGNGPWGVGLPLLYPVSKPASYPEVIAVGGSNAEQKPWRDSSNGAEVDICVPAENIRRARAGWINLTEHVQDTDQSEGTSMSAALAAGVAALWISYHGWDKLLAHYQNDAAKIPQAFHKIIATTGHRSPNDWDTSRYGAGLLDAARVLRAPLPTL